MTPVDFNKVFSNVYSGSMLVNLCDCSATTGDTFNVEKQDLRGVFLFFLMNPIDFQNFNLNLLVCTITI